MLFKRSNVTEISKKQHFTIMKGMYYLINT